MSGAVASTLGRLGFGAMAGWENDGNSLLESRGKPWKALDLRDQHINTMVSGGSFFSSSQSIGVFCWGMAICGQPQQRYETNWDLNMVMYSPESRNIIASGKCV